MGLKNVGSKPNADQDVVRKVDVGPPFGTSTQSAAYDSAGGFIGLEQSFTPSGSDPNPLQFAGYRNGATYKSFWLNESLAARFASVNDESAVKIFGPDANHSYNGYVVGIMSDYTRQNNLFAIKSDGNPYVGTGYTQGSWCIVLGSSDSVPSGLPVGTVIIRTP